MKGFEDMCAHRLAACCLVALAALPSAAAAPEPWADETVTEINRLPARADAYPLPDVAAALKEPAENPFVKTLDGSVSTTYYDYIMNHQKFAPWDPFVNKVRSMLKPSEEEVTPEAEVQASAGKGGQPAMPNAWRLTRRQEELVKFVKESITCGIDKKTGILTIHITDQDPLVCATMADSVRLRLQNFITDYRTGKARIDVEYYEKLVEQSKETYDKAFARYAAFADSHQNAVLASVSSQESELENEMDKAYSTYTAFRTQLESAQAKVQERTPAFHVLEPPSVPAKPAGPKRMIFVAFMTLLAALGTTIWPYRKEISSLLHGEE